MDAARLGRRSLRLDAIYCFAVAACLAGFARPLSRALDVPVVVLVGASVATAAWALLLHRVAGSQAVRPQLVRVLVANTVGALLIGALALSRPLDALSLLLLAVAVEVGAFAVSQGLALRQTA